MAVGRPACGKTTYVRAFFPSHVHVSFAAFGGREACVEAMTQCLVSFVNCWYGDENSMKFEIFV